MDQPQLIKCVVVGDSGVGKSSILLRYSNDEFDEFSEPTLGAAFVSKTEFIDNKLIKFQIWDTAGQEKYQSIAPIYYKQSEVALCVYDISNKNSFLVMNRWVKELENHGPENITIVIVGNKIDKSDEEEVPYQQGKDYADSIGALFKLTSAKESKGISEMFISIGESYLGSKKNKAASKPVPGETLVPNDSSRSGRKRCCK